MGGGGPPVGDRGRCRTRCKQPDGLGFPGEHGTARSGRPEHLRGRSSFAKLSGLPKPVAAGRAGAQPCALLVAVPRKSPLRVRRGGHSRERSRESQQTLEHPRALWKNRMLLRIRGLRASVGQPEGGGVWTWPGKRWGFAGRPWMEAIGQHITTLPAFTFLHSVLPGMLPSQSSATSQLLDR